MAAALLMSYATLPFLATTAFALVVRMRLPRRPCFFHVGPASSPDEVQGLLH